MVKKIILLLLMLLLFAMSVYNSVFDLAGEFLFVLLVFALFAVFVGYSIKSQTVIHVRISETLLLLVLMLLPIFSYYRFITVVDAYILASGLFFYIILSEIFTEKNKRFFLVFIFYLGLFQAFSGFFEYIVTALYPKSSLSLYFISHSFISGGRVSSFFQYPNAFAGFLLLPFFISMYFSNKEKTKLKRTLFAISAGFILFVLYLASSRGSYIVLILSLILLFFLTKEKKEFTVNFTLIFLFSILLYGLNYNIFHNSIVSNMERTKILAKFFAGEQNQSLSDRVQLAKDAINIFIHHPILGTGLGTFKDAMLKYRVGLFFAKEPHSMPFRILAESGIVGFVVLFYFYLKKFLRGLMYEPHIFIGVFALFLHTFLDLDFAFPLISNMIFASLALFPHSKEKAFVIGRKVSVFVLIGLIAFIVVSIIPNFVAAIYYKGGNTALENKNLSAAAASFKLSLKLQNGNAKAHSKLALCYEEFAYKNTSNCSNYLALSEKEYRNAEDCNNLSFIFPFYEGSIRLLRKDPLSAKCFKKSYGLNPLWEPILANVALSEAYTGQDKREAIKNANKALSFKAPKSAYAALRYTTESEKDSIAYTALGFSTGVAHYFDKAIFLDKNNGFAYFGKSLKTKGLLLKTELLRRSLNANPCIVEARKLYFSTAPLINVTGAKFNRDAANIDISVNRHPEFIRKINVYVIYNEKEILLSSFRGEDRKLEFSIPRYVKGKFRIKIEGIDKNGITITGVVSPWFDRK